MSARPANFKQADVKRAIKAAMSACADNWRVEIEPGGKIVISCEKGATEGQRVNSWDRVLQHDPAE